MADADEVELMRDETQPLHLGGDLSGASDPADVASTEGSSFGTTPILDDTESETVISLSGLDAEVRSDGPDTSHGSPVGDLPPMERAPVLETGPADESVSAEGLLEKIDGLGSHLFDGDSLGEHRSSSVLADAHGIGTSLDTDGAIGVDDAGQVSEDESVHSASHIGGEVTPFYSDDWLTLYGGDALTVLRSLPSNSVDTVCTSPPYWGLRSYVGNDDPNKAKELGLERTPEEYVANMVAVFAEVRRVLKPSGTCWLNLGDSYSGAKGDTYGGFNERYRGKASVVDKQADAGRARVSAVRRESVRGVPGSAKDYGDRLKPKDLVGIPWRVAFALQADGWFLRSDIIWAKPNPMPESVTDRPTKAHEYLFLLTKSARYYFDADAVREPILTPPQMLNGQPRVGRVAYEGKGNPEERSFSEGATFLGLPAGGRNIRSVWTIATRPYPGAHFAVFPPELPERCIKAGSSERGVCPECGAPWERVVERTPPPDFGRGDVMTGWCPTCDHRIQWRPDKRPYKALGDYLNPVTAVILDPFAGSGTVGMVANRLSRRAILIDLNPAYLKQQMRRNAQTPLGLSA